MEGFKKPVGWQACSANLTEMPKNVADLVREWPDDSVAPVAASFELDDLYPNRADAVLKSLERCKRMLAEAETRLSQISDRHAPPSCNMRPHERQSELDKAKLKRDIATRGIEICDEALKVTEEA